MGEVKALRIVMKQHEADELAEVHLSLERARMEREDFRQGMAPALYADKQRYPSTSFALIVLCDESWRKRSRELQTQTKVQSEGLSEIAYAAHVGAPIKRLKALVTRSLPPPSDSEDD